MHLVRDLSMSGGFRKLEVSSRRCSRSIPGKGASLCRGGSIFRIQCKIRVWIYVDDEGRAVRIDVRIAAEPEQVPASQRKLLKRLGQFRARPVLDRSGEVYRHRPGCQASIWRHSRRSWASAPLRSPTGSRRSATPDLPKSAGVKADVAFTSFDIGFSEIRAS